MCNMATWCECRRFPRSVYVQNIDCCCPPPARCLATRSGPGHRQLGHTEFNPASALVVTDGPEPAQHSTGSCTVINMQRRNSHLECFHADPIYIQSSLRGSSKSRSSQISWFPLERGAKMEGTHKKTNRLNNKVLNWFI